MFVLGLILGSLAMRLHLTTEPDELRIFVRSRSDLMRANPRLHPVLSQIIEKMTELDRRKRPQDLRQIANALAHYREPGHQRSTEKRERRGSSCRIAAVRSRLQQQLRDRLFEINRRNRLIYFRETSATDQSDRSAQCRMSSTTRRSSPRNSFI